MDRIELLGKAVEQVKNVADDIEYMNDCEGPRYEPSVDAIVEIIRMQNEAHRLLREIDKALVPAQQADLAAALEIVKASQPKARNPWAHAD